MKAKKGLLIGIIAALLITFSVIAAQAAEKYHCDSATITKAGIYSYSKNTRTIYAVCDQQNTWEEDRMFFIPRGNNEDAMYAAALTALASGYKVELSLSKFSVGSLVRTIIVVTPTE